MEFYSSWTLKFCEIVMILVIGYITVSDAQCNPTSGGVKRFGTNCELRCHCLNNEQCDAETGNCTSGCDYEWTGDGCQYRNIALGKSSRHLDNTYPVQFSDRANDRNVTTCSFTGDANTLDRLVAPWWALLLPNAVTFKEFVFTTQKKYLPYFPDFVVSVQQDVSEYDHTTKKHHPGQTCYHHDKSIPIDRSVHVKCTQKLSGNQLRLQLANTSTQLVICDLRVFGECKDREWGKHCQNTCGFCYNLSSCDAENGRCLNGCEFGYKNTMECTTVCDDGKYGKSCSSHCSANCVDVCDKVNGTCFPCKAGWKGDYCTTVCDAGKYGLNCKGTCSANCVDVCDKVNGLCSSCKAGWKGAYCTTECDDGKYGKSCSRNCSSNCVGVCNKVNGTCSPCEAGWKGDYCTTECHDGKYGISCSRNCSANCFGVCDKVNGTCSPCEAGWEGDYCTTECASNKWGINCNEDCGNCLHGSCNKLNGSCSGGCKPGYKHTDMCQDECDIGTHGDKCNLNCSVNCATPNICSAIDGTCDGCSTGWIGEFCDNEMQMQSFPVAAVAGGAFAAAVLIVLFVVVGLVISRQRIQNKHDKKNSYKDGVLSPAAVKEDDTHQRESKICQNTYVNAVELHEQLHETPGVTEASVVGENEAEYINDSLHIHHVTKCGIPISDFKAYVKTGLATKESFVKQFQEIPYGMQYPATKATMPGNVKKNRYKLMYAYDHSRVILKKIPGQANSDYINATNLKGYSGENVYIAAQGPIIDTLEDFWRMIWEKNVHTIIMVTNLSEEGKMKCKQYWPEDNASVQHGNIIAFMESEDVYTEFTVRRLKVSHGSNPGRQRTMTQFHYTAWPDKDVPRCTSSLLYFWYQVRKHDEKKTDPWLVHCSAGVGRTGTFIAIDILYDQSKDKGSIDVYNCVSGLREQRVNLVQTKDQYKFLHSIMVEALVLPWQPVHIEKFSRIYDELKQVEQTTGKTHLLLQYETLSDEPEAENVQESQNEMYTSAKRTENRSKNRYDNILAPNEFRPFLSTHVPGCTDYINAVYIPGYRHMHGYLVTQTPLPATAVDCCRLIIEEEIQIIVTFEDDDNKEVETYLPETGNLKIGPFNIEFVSEEEKIYNMQRNYEIKYQTKKHTITQLIFKRWLPPRLTPAIPNEMLGFLQELEQMQRQTDSKPVLVQCLNGAERSGIVVVLMNILERVRFDKEVSIIQVIRQLKKRRQQIIPNFEQFKFCHDVLLSYVQYDSTYANI